MALPNEKAWDFTGMELRCDQVTAATSLTVAGNTVTGTEFAVVDGVTAGTVTASKAVVVDANKDIGTFRNVTLSGNLVTGATTLSETDLAKIDAITNGTAAANKAVVLGATKNIDTIDVAQAGLKVDAVVVSPIKWVDVAATAALLDAAGTAPVIAGVAGDQYKIREIILVGGGTNFGAGGDRTIVLTDGTTVWTTIANVDIEAAPAASLRWGDAKVPFATGTSNTASVAGQAIRFAYAGGTTDHGGAGSITFSVCLEKVA